MPSFSVLLEVRLPLRAARRVNLVPEARHLPEAVLLVVVVLGDRVWLDDVVLQQRFEVPVEMRHRAEAEPRRLDRVHLHDAGLRQMRGGAEAQLLRFVQQGRHDLGPLGADLQAVDAVVLRPVHPLARRLRRLRAALAPAGPRPLIVEDARRHNLVPGAALLLFHRQRVLGQRHAAHRRHAVREPQLVGVFRFRILGRAAGVHVRVDEARHHVHPGRVDLVVGPRGTIRAQRHPGRPGVADGRDPVAADDDVDRPARRAARAVDQHRAADHQRLIRAEALALRAVRRRRQRVARGWRIGGRLNRVLSVKAAPIADRTATASAASASTARDGFRRAMQSGT